MSLGLDDIYISAGPAGRFPSPLERIGRYNTTQVLLHIDLIMI